MCLQLGNLPIFLFSITLQSFQSVEYLLWINYLFFKIQAEAKLATCDMYLNSLRRGMEHSCFSTLKNLCFLRILTFLNHIQFYLQLMEWIYKNQRHLDSVVLLYLLHRHHCDMKIINSSSLIEFYLCLTLQAVFFFLFSPHFLKHTAGIVTWNDAFLLKPSRH